MLFLDFKILRLDVLMICCGATFTRPARAPLASTSEKGMAVCSQHNLSPLPTPPSARHACSATTPARVAEVVRIASDIAATASRSEIKTKPHSSKLGLSFQYSGKQWRMHLFTKSIWMKGSSPQRSKYLSPSPHTLAIWFHLSRAVLLSHLP